MDILIALLLAWLVGLIGGFVVFKTTKKDKPVGTLRIDTSDPDDGPYLFLELASDPRTLMGRKTVTLDVNTESYISQE